ncbi:MAG TPA: M24 family metallopeptidase, partial [Saprospiraceae bacterium]|nr:M24 family metallopeptidase [Saprospiraceae bacterium]
DQAASVGIHKTGSLSDLQSLIQQAVSQHRIVHYLPPYRQLNTLKLAQWLGRTPAEITAHPSRKLIETVISQRAIKSEEELEEITVAVNLTRDMHIKMMEMAQPGVHEQAINAAVTAIALAAGSMPAYPNIISIHGETLHNHAHGNVLKAGQFLVGDFGAESPMHYAGDITRTCPVGGAMNDIQHAIYNLVLKAEMDSIEQVAPGVPYRDIHLNAAKIIASGLKDLGLMKGDVDEAVAAGAHALFFPHGLGHMLGLDVHDMEDLDENLVGYLPGMDRSKQFGLKSLRLARPLLPGFVFTVEPGIYFIPTLINLWKAENKFAQFLNYAEIEKLKDFGGIRIEDNVVVTDIGVRILGKPILKTAEEVCVIIKNA